MELGFRNVSDADVIPAGRPQDPNAFAVAPSGAMHAIVAAGVALQQRSGVPAARNRRPAAVMRLRS
jgi:hypothetical protein